MQRVIKTVHEIEAPSNKVWGIIAKGDGVESWLPIIKSSSLQGGNKRYCEMHEGGKLEETILISNATQTFIYSIDKQDAFPATDIVGIIRIEPLTEGSTRLKWDVEMNVKDDTVFEELKQNIVQLYQMSAQKLSELAH